MEIARRAPRATLCLVTALARHGLTDQMPARIDIALPRGERARIVTVPVTWHRFAAATFNVGREATADVSNDADVPRESTPHMPFDSMWPWLFAGPDRTSAWGDGQHVEGLRAGLGVRGFV